jgi:arginase family enzyme
LLEEEGVRMARPEMVPVPEPTEEEPADAQLKHDAALAKAVGALAEIVSKVNRAGDFPLVLGGDQTATMGHLLGHSLGHPQGIGLAVLADAYLDLAAPAPIADDPAKLRSDPGVTKDGGAYRMVLSGLLRRIPDRFELGQLLARSSVQANQTSVAGTRAPAWSQIRQAERQTGIEVWPTERIELEGESAYRSMLTRHLAAGPIALSIDASGLDPHLMTAVAEPVPDGLDWSFLKRTLDQCVPHVDRLLGIDLCHVDPTKDNAHHSAISRLCGTLAPFLSRLVR